MFLLYFNLLSIVFAYNQLFTPSGKYCGQLSSLITITTIVRSPTIIDLDITVFGSHFICPNEVVILHQNNTISFPNSYSRTNCIYKIFDEFGRSDITFSYNSIIDRVDVNIPEMGILQLKRCKTK